MLRTISFIHMHFFECLDIPLDPVTETELNTQIQALSTWNRELQSQLGSNYAPNQVRKQ